AWSTYSPTTGTAWNTTCAGICGDDATKPAPAGSTSEPDSADHDKITISDCRSWRGIARDVRLTDAETRELRHAWAAAMRAEGFEQVWVDLATGHVAARDAGSLRIGDGGGS